MMTEGWKGGPAEPVMFRDDGRGCTFVGVDNLSLLCLLD